ncbi:hypothetical protein [Streptomyces candidus]|uniref:Uncharacterized protein n=1 Tax=Streptomyces candidus TaxID=67283 RepID=A0A7X0HLS1_9ACTN|nr:hypothetical protein [Streptomyces candidus]MBB6439850.1 hypothetical protein [Streptomyces candidus]GHH55922.1 hypothetical protein GCM10018773_61020 [Streptomyces candidus]
MVFALYIAFAVAVLLLTWAGPIVLLLAARTRFLAPWLLAVAVTGIAAAYALGSAETGSMAMVFFGPSVVTVLIYLGLRWGFRESPRTGENGRTLRSREDT